MIQKLKDTVPWIYIINDLNGEENEQQKASQEEFRIEKVIKIKGDKLYVKWIGFDNCLNSWIDKKDIVSNG